MKKIIAGFIGAAVILIYFGQACSQDTAGEATTSSSRVGTQSNNLMASPQTILVNSQAVIQPNGGTPPYNYAIVSGSGNLSANLFTAPSMSGVTFIKITDALGASVIDTISITVSSSGVTGTPTPTPTPGPTPPPAKSLPIIMADTYAALQAYVPSCTSANPLSDVCASAVHRYCVGAGYDTGFGLIQTTAANVNLTCLPATAETVITTSFTTLQTFVPSCNGGNAHSDLCNSAVSRFCTSQGFVSGFGPVEHVNDVAVVSCVNSNYSGAGGQSFSALTSFDGSCNLNGPVSLGCNHAIQSYCVSLGYSAGGFGAIEHNGNYLGLVCVRGQ